VSDRKGVPVFILHKSTVQATFNAPCELLGVVVLSAEEVGVLYESWGIGGVKNSLENSLVSTMTYYFIFPIHLAVIKCCE